MLRDTTSRRVFGFTPLCLLDGLTLYSPSLAGLKLLSTHAGVFRQYLTEDSEKMYGRIAPLCQHQNKKLRDHALAALDAFLGQVSSELVSTQRDPASNRDTFKVRHLTFSAALSPC